MQRARHRAWADGCSWRWLGDEGDGSAICQTWTRSRIIRCRRAKLEMTHGAESRAVPTEAGTGQRVAAANHMIRRGSGGRAIPADASVVFVYICGEVRAGMPVEPEPALPCLCDKRNHGPLVVRSWTHKTAQPSQLLSAPRHPTSA